MNDLRQAHPSFEQLSAFGLGQLDDVASAEIAAHLGTCGDCCGKLQTVRADGFVARLRSAAGTRPDGGPTAHDKAQVSEAPTQCDGTAPALSAQDLPPELAHHPRYRILEVLGAGGMGTVFKAMHLLMERPVALKVIRQDLTRDGGAVERFRREVKAAARLTHPNIVHAYDAEQAGDAHFLVMEFVEGKSLDRVVAEEGRLPVARACEYVRQAALGLQHAFERGMVHRDVKPHNLMRTPDGTIKILDFGLARFARETARAASPASGPAPAEAGSLTQTGSLMGTPDYMAPEQAANPHEADIRADLYSLGCTLYFLLTGSPPFAGSTGLDKIMAHIEQIPQPLTDVRPDAPAGLAGVLGRLLAKDPARRYQTPAEAAAALEPYTHPSATPAPLPEEQPAPRRPRRGRRLRWVLGGLGGAAFVVGAVLIAQGDAPTVRDRLRDIYTICAVLGGTLMVCQFLLSLLGLGHHHEFGSDAEAAHDFGGHDHPADGHDVGHEAQASWYVGVLTFRTLVAALLFFGLAGRAAEATDLDAGTCLLVALCAGGAALFGVAWMMRTLYRLRADGTVRIDRAVGSSGTVYLTVPANKAGLGKVLLNVQNRTVEYQAVTPHQALPTGSPVRVLAVVNADTVEVISAKNS
jgi:hypothetical protein